MNCDLANQLIDDYIDGELSTRECQRLEKHMAKCPSCAQQLQERFAFDRSIQQALTSAVHHVRLEPAASQRILEAVEATARKPTWHWYVVQSARLLAGVLAGALLLAGMLLLLERWPMVPELQPAARSPGEQAALSVDRRQIYFQPASMQPGDRFTITVPIESGFAELVDPVRCDLDIEGPTGQYRFALFMEGPMPARGLSILQVTPEMLALPSQAQYGVSPTEIFGLPGTYTFRVTLYSPIDLPIQ
jgi:hypothetical protein